MLHLLPNSEQYKKNKSQAAGNNGKWQFQEHNTKCFRNSYSMGSITAVTSTLQFNYAALSDDHG